MKKGGAGMFVRGWLLYAVGFMCCGLGAADTGKPAVAGVLKGQGKVPYEISLAGRREAQDILFGFDDMNGWRIALHEGAGAELQSTTEAVLWEPGNPVARLRYHGASLKSRMILEPPAPLPVPEGKDTVSLWCHGNNWGWVPDPETPRVMLTLLLKGSKTGPVRVALAQVRWKTWWLIYKVLPGSLKGQRLWVMGLEIAGCANKKDRNLYFESLRFLNDSTGPLTFKPRPARNITLFEGQSPGLNTASGRLPFPTREETILPVNVHQDFQVKAGWTRRGEAFYFQYQGPDGKLTYHIHWPDGWPVVEAQWGKKARFQVLSGAGILMAAKPAASTWRLKAAEGADNQLSLTCENERNVRVTHVYRLWQKSLVWDVTCRGGQAASLTFGDAGPFRKGELIPIPYLTYGASNPPVAMVWPDADTGLFMTVWPDWYRSNASAPVGNPVLAPDGAGRLFVRQLGAMNYVPRTDGRRNDLYERIFLTVSPVYEEVLPVIPNPASPHAEAAGGRLWQESWGPSDFEREKKRSRLLRAHGITQLTQCNHEIAWRDGGESFTLRLMAAPGKGGDDGLKAFVKHQKSLGWLSGLYTNYTDFAPINRHWNPDWVQRTPEGQLRTAWPRCYALKPAKAVEFDAHFAPRIQKKFGSTAAYTDVHTAVAPWQYCDFDHRVPGAATFAQTIYLYGEILLHDRSVYGPTWSEGSYHWLYAGLASGNYGLCYSGVDIGTFPLLPVFDLREIHSRECDIGVPWTSGFLKRGDWRAKDRIDHGIDRFIAATMAYGHIGWLVEEAHGLRRTCRSYYMMLPVQKAYAQVPPDRIRYGRGERELVPVSDALRDGSWRQSRLFVDYRDRLALHVNGGEDLWICGRRPAAGRKLPGILPAAGYQAEGPDCLVYSGLWAGRRRDLSVCREFLYADARDDYCTFPFGLSCRGGTAVRKVGDGRLEVIDCGGNEWIGLGGGKAPWIPSDVAAALCAPLKIQAVHGYSAEGKKLGPSETRQEMGMAGFKVMAGAVRYELRYARQSLSPAEKIALQKKQEGKAAWPDRPAFFAVPVKREIALGEGRIRLYIDPRKAGAMDAVRSGLPDWLTLSTPLAGKAGVFAFNITNPGKVPQQGALLSLPFAVRQVRKTVADLLSSSVPRMWRIHYRGRKPEPGTSASGASCSVTKRACGGVEKPCLFAHPPYQGGVGSTLITFGPLALPETPAVFSASAGIADGGDLSDGVVFSVSVRLADGTGGPAEKRLVKRPGWQDIRMDLNRFAGKSVYLILETDPGQADNTTSDWACWGTPAVKSRELQRVMTFKGP